MFLRTIKPRQRPCKEDWTQPLLPVVQSQGPKESIPSLLLPSPFTLFVRMLLYFLVEMLGVDSHAVGDKWLACPWTDYDFKGPWAPQTLRVSEVSEQTGWSLVPCTPWWCCHINCSILKLDPTVLLLWYLGVANDETVSWKFTGLGKILTCCPTPEP